MKYHIHVLIHKTIAGLSSIKGHTYGI